MSPASADGSLTPTCGHQRRNAPATIWPRRWPRSQEGVNGSRSQTFRRRKCCTRGGHSADGWDAQTGLTCAPAMVLTAREPSPGPFMTISACSRQSATSSRAAKVCALSSAASAATHGASSWIAAWTDVHGQEPVLYLLPSRNERGSASDPCSAPAALRSPPNGDKHVAGLRTPPFPAWTAVCR